MEKLDQFEKYLFRDYLEEDEEIDKVIHHRIFPTVKVLFKHVFFFIAIPATIMYIFNVFFLNLVGGILIIVGILKFSSVFLSWFFNALLVTNQSLLLVERKGLFSKQASRTEYGQVESFSYNIDGFFNTILGFGDLIIEKSSGQSLEITGVRKPKPISEELTDIQDNIVNTQLKRDHEGLKDTLTTLLKAHIEEHGITVVDDEPNPADY